MGPDICLGRFFVVLLLGISLTLARPSSPLKWEDIRGKRSNVKNRQVIMGDNQWKKRAGVWESRISKWLESAPKADIGHSTQ